MSGSRVPILTQVMGQMAQVAAVAAVHQRVSGVPGISLLWQGPVLLHSSPLDVRREIVLV